MQNQGIKWTARLDDLMSKGLGNIQKRVDRVQKVTAKADKVNNKFRNGLRKSKKNFDRVGKSADKARVRIKKFKEAAGNAYGSLQSSRFGKVADMVTKPHRMALKQTRKIGSSIIDTIGNQAGAIGQFAPMLSNPYTMAGAAVVMAGKHIMDVSVAIEKKQHSVAKSFGVTTEEAKGLAAQGEAIRRVLGKDFEQSMQAANVQAKQFGIDGAASTELYKRAVIAGADATGELFGLVKEYSSQSVGFGLNASEQLALIADSVQKGFDPDKVLDSFKEVRLRVANQGVGSALGQKLSQNFGQKFTKGLLDAVNSGEMNYFDFVKKVSKKSNDLNLGDAQITEMLGVLGGGPLEDAGANFFRTVGGMTTNLDEMVKKGQEMNPTLSRQIELTEQIALKQQGFSKSWNDANERIKVAKLEMELMFYEGYEKIQPLLEKIGSVISGFMSWAENSQFVQDVIGVLFEVGSYAFDFISRQLDRLTNLTTGWGKSFENAYSKWIKPVFAWIMDKVGNLAAAFLNLIAFDFEAVGKHLNNVWDSERTVKIDVDKSESIISEEQRKALGLDFDFNKKLDELNKIKNQASTDLDKSDLNNDDNNTNNNTRITSTSSRKKSEIAGVASGGKQVKHINVRIDKMVETMVIEMKQNVEMTEAEIRRRMEAVFVKMIQNTELTMSNN